MITTGIIKEINKNKGNFIGNAYRVEINLFQIPGDFDTNNYTYLTNCNAVGGMYNSYDVNDKVYIGFINDDTSLPIILGKIYQGITDEARGYANLKTLKVVNSTTLSIDTVIGDITYKQLHDALIKIDNLEHKLNNLLEEINTH